MDTLSTGVFHIMTRELGYQVSSVFHQHDNNEVSIYFDPPFNMECKELFPILSKELEERGCYLSTLGQAWGTYWYALVRFPNED